MMNSDKALPWYLRIMYLLPVLLCITITLTTVIQYTRTEAPPVSVSETELKEETERGKEILEEQQAQGEGES